eukprot:8230278-Prorocentrum_lima.AAC.1
MIHKASNPPQPHPHKRPNPTNTTPAFPLHVFPHCWSKRSAWYAMHATSVPLPAFHAQLTFAVSRHCR